MDLDPECLKECNNTLDESYYEISVEHLFAETGIFDHGARIIEAVITKEYLRSLAIVF